MHQVLYKKNTPRQNCDFSEIAQYMYFTMKFSIIIHNVCHFKLTNVTQKNYVNFCRNDKNRVQFFATFRQQQTVSHPLCCAFSVHIYTGFKNDTTMWPKNTAPWNMLPNFGDNFVKCQPILKSLSPLAWQLNFQQNFCNISNHTLTHVATIPREMQNAQLSQITKTFLG